jgi:Holliday junction resolvase RusA-like endonuclease
MTAARLARLRRPRKPAWLPGRHPLDLTGHRDLTHAAVTAILTEGSPQAITFTVPGQPVPKARIDWAADGHAYPAPATAAHEEKIRAAFLTATRRMIGDQLSPWGIIATFHVPDRRVRDEDNMLKTVKDALNTICYADDNQVTEAAVRKALDAHRPRTEITVYVVPHPLIGPDRRLAQRVTRSHRACQESMVSGHDLSQSPAGETPLDNDKGPGFTRARRLTE